MSRLLRRSAAATSAGLVAAVASAFLSFGAGRAPAAVINVIGGDAGEGLTLNSSAVVNAYNLANATAFTVQGVTVQGTGGNGTYGSLAIGGAGTFTVNGSFAASQNTANDTALSNVLSSNLFASSNGQPITLTVSGLTANTSYKVETLVSLGTLGQTRTETLSINGSPLDTFSYSGANNQAYNVQETATASGSGVLTITLQDNTANPAGAIVNGLVVSTVPEPAALGLGMMSGGLLLARRRRNAFPS